MALVLLCLLSYSYRHKHTIKVRLLYWADISSLQNLPNGPKRFSSAWMELWINVQVAEKPVNQANMLL